MSTYSSPLRCNRCWKPLVDGFAWVTSCSHIFCEDDANKYFSRQSTCPCCNSSINREIDLKRVRPDLENSPAMILWGQSPALILEASASALGFFMYQKKQEIAWMNHIVSQKDKQQQSLQVAAQQQIKERDEHIIHLNEKVSSLMEELQRKNAALTELKKTHKDMTRICRNYEKLYNQMKTVKHMGDIGESPSPADTKIACIGPLATQQKRVGTPNFIESDRTKIDSHSSKVISKILTSSKLPPSGQQSIFETEFDQNRKTGPDKRTIPLPSVKPRRQSCSSDGLTPNPLKTRQALSKTMQSSTKNVVHPLNKYSPHTMMRLTTTPGAITTPMSIFQSMRPSLYSRFSIQRRK